MEIASFKVVSKLLSCFCLGIILLFMGPQAAKGQSGDQANQNTGITLSIEGGELKLKFVRDEILHVRFSPTGDFNIRENAVVITQADAVRTTSVTDGDFLNYSTNDISVLVNTVDGSLTVRNQAGDIALELDSPGLAADSEPDWSVEQRFSLSDEEGVFGLGQFQEGWMNYRGRQVLLAHSNTRAAVPFLLSSKGYGILWNTFAKSLFDDSSGQPRFLAEAVTETDYYVIVGTNPREAMSGYRKLTGKAPMFPKTAYGFWQSRETYTNQYSIVDVAREYRKREIPIDNIVQDWNYWPGFDHFSGMTWDSTRFPDPAAAIDTLHDMNYQVMASIWPAAGVRSAIHGELDQEGLLFPGDHWSPSHVYDAYNSKARDIYWKHAKAGIYDKGVDAFWLDGTEPEFRSTDDRYVTEQLFKANEKSSVGPIDLYLNGFSLYHSKGMFEHLSSESNRRPFILTRSAFSGQQRFGTTLWSGDIWASWTIFRDQISAGLNVGMAGIPYWTSDIGSFITNHRFPEGNQDPAFRELYTRWYQFGAFSPIFRSHGTNTEREIWYFGEPGDPFYDAIKDATTLRYRLMPYIYTQAWNVHKNDGLMMQALPFVFPDDRKGYDIDNAFMFGDQLLVSPVTKAMLHEPPKFRKFITTQDLSNSSDTRHYLSQEVYSGINFDSLMTIRPVENLRMTWQGSLPSEAWGMPYSLRNSGKLNIEKTGVHTFFCTAKGGVRLRIKGELLIDSWKTMQADRGKDGQTEMKESWEDTEVEEYRADINLLANTKAEIVLEYQQPQPNQAKLILEWREPSLREEIVNDSETWRTYLPEGEEWIDFWTGKKSMGGRYVTSEAPISRIPLFVRAGSILPLGPEIQFVGHKPTDPIELRIYPGKKRSYSLYEDAGNGQGYLSAEYTEIQFKWNDENKELTIGKRKGNFPGMLKERNFHVIIVSENGGIGLNAFDLPDTKVKYDGSKKIVKL